MFSKTLILLLLGLVAVSAQAHDDRARTAVGAGLGAAVGAAIGSEIGGRNEAILGGAIGGAVGAVIVSDDRHDRRPHYRRARRYDDWDDGRYDHWERRSWHDGKHRGPPHCPPGLAKQGRC